MLSPEDAHRKKLEKEELDIVETVQTIVDSVVPLEKTPLIYDMDDGDCQLRFSDVPPPFCKFDIRTESKKFVCFYESVDRENGYSVIEETPLQCDYDNVADIIRALKEIKAQIQAIAKRCVG